MELAQRAVDAATGNDQVGVAQIVGVLDLALELDLHPELRRTLDEDVEQRLAADAVAVPAHVHGLLILDGQ